MEDNPEEWLYDYTLQFLSSPGWKIPILSFIDEHCFIFDMEEENKLEYTVVHKKFEEMVEILLEGICIELGATHEMFFRVVKAGLKNPRHKKYFEQILATLNFMSFKKLMVKRNKELELEAMEMLHNEGHVPHEDLQKAHHDKDMAEIEHAIAVSIAAEAERLRLEQEEEELIRKIMQESEEEYKKQQEAQRAETFALVEASKKKESEKVAKMKQDEKERYEKQQRDEAEKKRREEEEYRQREMALLQNKQREEETRRKLEREQKRIEEERKVLPPVIPKKVANVDLSEFQKLDVSGELKESAELDEINKKIAAKYAEKKADGPQGAESLEERAARLKRQRELILKKKQEERAAEMQNYLNNGGTDLTAKKDLGVLPPIISQEEIDKRRNVMNKLRSIDPN